MSPKTQVINTIKQDLYYELLVNEKNKKTNILLDKRLSNDFYIRFLKIQTEIPRSARWKKSSKSGGAKKAIGDLRTEKLDADDGD